MEQRQLDAEVDILGRLKRLLFWYAVVSLCLGVPLALAGAVLFFLGRDNFIGLGTAVAGVYMVVVAWAMRHARRALQAGEPDAPRLARVSLIAALPGALVTLSGSLVIGLVALKVLFFETWFGIFPAAIAAVILFASAGVLDLLLTMLLSGEVDAQVWSEVEPDGDELVVFDLDADRENEAVEESVSSYRGL